MLELLNTKFMAGLGGGLASGLGGALQAAPAGPSNATSAAYGSGLDASGWAVNFQGVQSASSSQDKSGGIPGLGLSGVGGGAIPWYVWAAVAGVVLWKARKSSR